MKITRRRVLGLLAGSAAAIGVPSAWLSRMKTYSGPVSDHFDGLYFFDPDGSPPKTLAQVLRWQFGRSRERAVWPEWAPSPYADTPPRRVEGGRVRFSFVGHASWLVQTRHWSARGLFDRNKALWASFVLETPAGKLYIVCDSGYGEGKHFRRVAEAHGPLRLAILPIGAYEPRWFMRDQHMNPSDAVKALADCGAEQALAHHHGTFQLTDEAIDAPAIALGEALDEAQMPREKFAVLKPGQVWEI